MSAENLNWETYNENETAKKLRKDAVKVVDNINLNDLRCLCMTVSSDIYSKLLNLLEKYPEAKELLNAMDHMQFIHHCGDTVSLNELNEAKEMIVKFYNPKGKTKK